LLLAVIRYPSPYSRFTSNSPPTIHRAKFIAHNSPLTIHHSQLTAHNSPRLNPTRHNSTCTIQRAQSTVVQFTAGTIHCRHISPRHNSPRHDLPPAQFITHNSTQHNSPRIFHHEKLKIPLDEFLDLLD
jgi:hypothetical protein